MIGGSLMKKPPRHLQKDSAESLWSSKYLPRLLRRQAVNFLLLGSFLIGITLLGQGLYIKAKAGLAQLLLQQAWSETLHSGRPAKAWPWADTFPVASIEIPAISSGKTIVLNGSSGEALAFGPGHLGNSASPGEFGTAIFAAHRDTHFAYLEQVSKGDIITVTNNRGQQFDYAVDQLRVAPWDASALYGDDYERRIALVTCWPFDALEPGPLRYIVEGHLVNETGPQ